MSTNIDELLDEDVFADTKPQGRNNFITVLCILSWVGIGLFIIYDIYKVFAYSTVGSLYNSTSVMAQGNLFGSQFGDLNKMMEYGKIHAIAQLICSLVALPATILMWNMKKIGFFLYLIAQVVPIVLYVVLMSNIDMGIFGSAWQIWGWFTYIPDFVQVAFVIMYGVNLKYMK